MNEEDRVVHTESFYLNSGGQMRFCILHTPTRQSISKSIIFVPPFAEEMNKSRRAVALQCRALAERGWAVLHVDMKGCGDSFGDFGDAGWDDWIDDIADADQWLRKRFGQRVFLWGLRLGGLLALDFFRRGRTKPTGIILWSPVLSGKAFLTQFLRLRVAGERLASGVNSQSTDELRRSLREGKALEVAGYLLSPRLALPIDELSLTDLAPVGIPVGWTELVSSPDQELSPAVVKAMQAWRDRGVKFDTRIEVGESFWSTHEITECRQLVDSTMLLVGEMA